MARGVRLEFDPLLRIAWKKTFHNEHQKTYTSFSPHREKNSKSSLKNHKREKRNAPKRTRESCAKPEGKKGKKEESSRVEVKPIARSRILPPSPRVSSHSTSSTTGPVTLQCAYPTTRPNSRKGWEGERGRGEGVSPQASSVAAEGGP